MLAADPPHSQHLLLPMLNLHRCHRPPTTAKAQLWGEFGLDLPSATVLPREEEHAVSTIIRKHQDAKDVVHVLQKRQLDAVTGDFLGRNHILVQAKPKEESHCVRMPRTSCTCSTMALDQCWSG